MNRTKAAWQEHRRPNNHMRHDLTDMEWAVIEPLLPRQGRMGRPRRTGLRRIVDAIQYLPGTGCRWRAIPGTHPPFSTVRNHFHTWVKTGILDLMLKHLQEVARIPAGRPTAGIIDSRSVRTTESGGPRGHDAVKKVNGRKRHIVTDVEGSPVEIAVHPASVQDRDGAPGVIGKALAKVPTMTVIRADGGCSGPKPASALKELDIDAELEIVGKNKDARGFDILPRRWVVERTFAWMGRCRRLSRDYERRTDTSMGWVTLSACRFLMRRIAREMGKLEMEPVQS